MPSPRTEHGSGVVAANDYAPGGRMVQPQGTKGAQPVYGDMPPRPRQRRAVTERLVAESQPPRKRGRPVGSKNRPPIPPELFDAPTDEG